MIATNFKREKSKFYICIHKIFGTKVYCYYYMINILNRSEHNFQNYKFQIFINFIYNEAK